MHNLTIRHRLLLLTLLPSTLIAIVLVAYFTYSGMKTLEGDLHLKGLPTVRYLAPISEYRIIAGQVEGLHGLAQATVQEPSVKAAIIVNQNGKTIAVSGRVSLSAETLRQAVAEPQLVADTDNWVGFAAPVRRSLSDIDVLFESPGDRAEKAPEVIGHVFVELDKNDLFNRQRQLMQRGLIIVLLGLLMLAALAIAMADNLARPVLRLAEAVRKMSAGRFDTRIPTVSTGELAVLENGFNEMAAHIEEVHHSMQSRIEEATAPLAYQARHDALTGLINRREFEHCLEKALASVRAGGDEFSVLFIDLDRFKQINDRCGYLAGDELLRQMAHLIHSRLRDEDILARLGGDEFCIILHACNAQRARQVAEDIRNLAHAYRFIWQDRVFAVGSSIGFTTVNRKVANISDILAAGDAACHTAKERGRNQVCQQDIALQERRQDNNKWDSRIASALTDGRMLIEAQPLSPLHPAAGMHVVELTARLNEPGQPPVALAALSDAAERYDLASAIDLRLIDAAISGLVRARSQKRLLVCIVPLSRSSLACPETIDNIAQRLTEHRLTGNRLCLLVAEDCLTHHMRQTMEFVQRARAIGCTLCLADFGAGLTSFNHLRSIGPSHVKLSSSLTRDFSANRTTSALLRAIHEITTDQEILTIADEVDTPELLDELAGMGVDGYMSS